MTNRTTRTPPASTARENKVQKLLRMLVNAIEVEANSKIVSPKFDYLQRWPFILELMI